MKSNKNDLKKDLYLYKSIVDPLLLKEKNTELLLEEKRDLEFFSRGIKYLEQKIQKL